MNISKIVIGAIGTNCYLITDEKSGESAVIDPGRYKAPLINFLDEHRVSHLKYIILTHGHYDHIMGVAELQADRGGEVLIHKDDAECLQSPMSALAKYSIGRHFVPCRADRLLSDGDEILLGETVLRVMHTPGHSPGSICLLTDGIMFSGDTLFNATVGRTDFERSDPHDMVRSIKKLALLEEDYAVYPGHGDSTTLTREKRVNPFFI